MPFTTVPIHKKILLIISVIDYGSHTRFELKADSVEQASLLYRVNIKYILLGNNVLAWLFLFASAVLLNTASAGGTSK